MKIALILNGYAIKERKVNFEVGPRRCVVLCMDYELFTAKMKEGESFYVGLWWLKWGLEVVGDFYMVVNKMCWWEDYFDEQ